MAFDSKLKLFKRLQMPFDAPIMVVINFNILSLPTVIIICKYILTSSV